MNTAPCVWLDVSRNPKDACVSSYYHAFNPFKSGWPFDAWASVWLQGHVSFGDWFAITKEWLELSQRWPNVLFVRYEDMKSEPGKTIRCIAEHIGVAPSDELIDRVVRKRSPPRKINGTATEAQRVVGLLPVVDSGAREHVPRDGRPSEAK